MGERKVLNKYYPPDFDPAKLPKGKRVRSEDKQMKVRMMLPMSVRCNTCGTFMYKGTKFNTRMEDVRGENYLGIKIFRFYYRCTHCSAEFCMKTDPKTADYVVEAGATRNYEPWRDQEKAKVDSIAQREEEERGNAMKALENRTLDSKREMDILSALDEMRSLKARHAQIDTEAALAALKRNAQQRELDLEEEDEEAVRQMLLQRAGFVRRLSDSDEEGREAEAGPSSAAAAAGGGGSRAASGSTGAAAGRKGKRKLGARGGGPLPVAAAAWEDEEGQEEEEQEEGGASAAAAFDAGGEGLVRDNGAGAAAAGGREPEAGAGRAGDEGGAGPAALLPQPPAAAGAAGRSEPTAATSRPKPAAAAPPPLPGFAVKARPVALVVKRKAVSGPSQPQQAQQQQTASEASEGGGGLAGLLGYGSGNSSESD